MPDRFGPLIIELVRQRAERIEERIRKLVDAGIPRERLFLVSDRSCQCAGTGIIVEFSGDQMRAHECPRCLGVGMIEVKTDVARQTMPNRLPTR